MPGMNPEGTDLLTTGASSAMPTSNATGGAMQALPQALQMLLTGATGQSQGMGGPLTTAQSTIPNYQPKPTWQANAPQVAQGGFASVGARKRADKQAMLNNLANLTNQANNFLEARKTREMTQMVTKIQQATQGKQQAEATLKVDKDNADAQEQLKQNQQILSDVFSDPKNVKNLQKAFSVKLMGDSKGQATPQYKGLMEALKNHDKTAQQQAGLALAQRFQQSLPSTQQLSPQMQGRADAIQRGLIPGAKEQSAEMIQLGKSLTTLTTDANNNQAKLDVAKILANAKDKESQARIQASVNQAVGRVEGAKIARSAVVYRVDKWATTMENDTTLRAAGEVLTRGIADPDKNATEKEKAQITQLKSLNSLYKEQYDTTMSELKNTKAKIDELKSTGADDTQLRDLVSQYKDLLAQKKIVEQGAGRVIQLSKDLPNDRTDSNASSSDDEDSGFDKLFE